MTEFCAVLARVSVCGPCGQGVTELIRIPSACPGSAPLSPSNIHQLGACINNANTGNRVFAMDLYKEQEHVHLMYHFFLLNPSN